MSKKKSKPARKWDLQAAINQPVVLFTTIGSFAGTLERVDLDGDYAVLLQVGRTVYLRLSSIIGYSDGV